jgi:hypothetical protein
LQTWKQFLKQVSPTGQQDVRMMTLRGTTARLIPCGETVSLDKHHSVYVIGEHARRYQPCDAGSNHNGLAIWGRCLGKQRHGNSPPS